MNHIIKLLFLCLFFATACSQEEMNEVLKNHAEMEGQANSIEELCKNMNRDIVALKLIINSSESGDYITGFKELADGSGYTISFFKSGTIVIKNGEKGDDGHTGEAGNGRLSVWRPDSKKLRLFPLFCQASGEPVRNSTGFSKTGLSDGKM